MYLTYFSGIELSVFDLFEMKRVSSIHCNISGGMNATNLRLLGACQQLPPTEKKEESEADTEEVHLSCFRFYGLQGCQ